MQATLQVPVGAVIEQPDGELAYGAPQLSPRVGGYAQPCLAPPAASKYCRCELLLANPARESSRYQRKDEHRGWRVALCRILTSMTTALDAFLEPDHESCPAGRGWHMCRLLSSRACRPVSSRGPAHRLSAGTTGPSSEGGAHLCNRQLSSFGCSRGALCNVSTGHRCLSCSPAGWRAWAAIALLCYNAALCGCQTCSSTLCAETCCLRTLVRSLGILGQDAPNPWVNVETAETQCGCNSCLGWSA